MSRLATSRVARRIVGGLGRGADLKQALIAACREQGVRCGRVQAEGVVDHVTLGCCDAEGRQGRARPLRGALQLVWAGGIVSEHEGQLHLELSVVGARQGDNGLELLGGVCTGARVVSCAFAVEAWDDVVLRLGVDAETGLLAVGEALGAGPQPADGPTPEMLAPRAAALSRVASKPSWEEAVMASVRAAAQAEAEEEVEPPSDEPERPVRVGDVIEHQKFGRCLVQKVDSDQEYVTVRLRNTRLVRLNLDVLRLRFSGEEEGHQVFVATLQG